MQLSAYQQSILLPELIRVSRLEGNENVSIREVAKIIMRTLSLSLNIRIAAAFFSGERVVPDEYKRRKRIFKY